MLRHLLRRLPTKHLIVQVKRNVGTCRLPKVKSLKPVGLLLGTALCQAEEKKDLKDYDIDMMTWSESESSIINLMNTLKESIICSSTEYRNCLNKQIEITVTATQFGHFSERWDDMPEYRLLADELKQEIDKYLSLIKTIGKIASDEHFASVLPKPEESLQMISSKYKELEDILNRELEENRRVEMELLRVKRDSIYSLRN